VHTSNAAITMVRYDGLGNRIEHASSNLGLWRYTHDDAGLLVEAIDPRGAKVVNQFDKLGRLHRQLAGDSRAAFKYHRRGLGTGMVRRISSRSGTTRVRKDFTYDARGRIESESWRVRAQGRSHDYVARYGYDDADRRTTVSYPGPERGSTDVLTTEYTPYGLPFAQRLEGAGGRTDVVHAVSYDLQGNVTRIDYGNGWSDRFSYTAAYQLSRLRCTRTAPYLATGTACSGTSDDLRRYRIAARDPAGNTLSTVDSLHAGTVLDQSTSHSYDALGRLVERTSHGGAVERFAYDAKGNITHSSPVGGLVYASASPHLATAVGGAEIQHDVAGNRVQKGPWTYTYDALGRLDEIEKNGALVVRNHYDEGRSRIARYDADSDEVTFYFGGLVEVDERATTRLFHFLDRVVAVDRIESDLSGAARNRTTDPATAGLASHSWLYAALTIAALLGLAVSRRRVAVSIALIFIMVTTLSPVARASERSGARERNVAARLLFFHSDERGSPEILTDSAGAVVEHRRYASYGRLLGAFGSNAQPIADESSTIAFNGHASDRDAGLVYFGSRFYDPELGLFLTPDPQAQYASPYLYGGGNPVYGIDRDGEAIFAFLAGILQPILASAVASSFVSAVTAAAQGGDVAGALVDGFVSGAAGAALGTALGGMNVAYQYAAGGSDLIGLGEALGAVIETAQRSAFTNTVSHAAATLSRAVGADSDWATVVDLGVRLLGSYVYDNFIVRDSGSSLGTGPTQRAAARVGAQRVNTTAGHMSVTEQATLGTGWESQSHVLANANVAQDGSGGFFGRAAALMSNESHFGRLPATMEKIHAELDGLLAGSASKLLGMNPVGATSGFVRALGGASHYVQDHLTLGHMVPGTALFAGPVGAPVRFVIHQVFGGEIAFRNAQVRATRALLARYGAPA
jgi:RHS repeat-associated protein